MESRCQACGNSAPAFAGAGENFLSNVSRNFAKYAVVMVPCRVAR